MYNAEALEAAGVAGAGALSESIHDEAYSNSPEEQFARLDAPLSVVLSNGQLRMGGHGLSRASDQAFAAYMPIWVAHTKKTHQKQRNLQTAYRRYNLNKWLPRIQKLYGSDTNHQTSRFQIFLCPHLSGGTSGAFPIGRRIFVQWTPGSAVCNLGVVVHEMCHLFFLDGTASQQKISPYSPGATLAQNYIDEALATAIGNSCVINRANQQPRGGAYDDPYIDHYSEALLPLVEE